MTSSDRRRTGLPIAPPGGRPAGAPDGADAAAPAEGAGPAFGPGRTPYDALGGDARVRALVASFYDHMDRDPAFAGIRALHPPDLAASREKLHAFLSGWLGGPPLYVERYGHPRLRARHLPFPIGARERDAWLACMARALDAGGVAGELRSFLDGRFAHVADFMRNRDGGEGAGGGA